jgi:hypothetical protein
MTKSSGSKKATESSSPSDLIDARIRELHDWRGETLALVRKLIHEADPDVVEEWKWRGVPVWSHNGVLCTGETYKDKVKLTFHKGAALADPAGLFNASLDGNARRAIDIAEGEPLDAEAFKRLIHVAVAKNIETFAAKSKTKKPDLSHLPRDEKTGVVLLSGGNPQIPKGDGDGPVQAYIAAMPGWKSELGQRLDAIITRTVPNVGKAVRWNSPFYGSEGQGWFLSFHCLTRYVKVTFFDGTSLDPIPPGGTAKSKESRWIDIYEDDVFDEEQFAGWVRQAAALPGWMV